MSKLIFLTENNPLYNDYKKAYSRIRFYADTLVKLSSFYNCDKVVIASPGEIKLDGRGCYTKEDSDFVYNSPLENFENCYYLKKTAKSYCNSEVEFLSIEDVEVDSDDIVAFGILNGSLKDMKLILSMYEPIISKSKYYIYLSSDAELTKEQYILNSRVSFLTLLPSLSRCFVDKLYKIFITEVADKDVLFNYMKVGISPDKVQYLPMIINCKERLVGDTNINCKNHRIMMLRGFEEWVSQSKDILNVLKGVVDIYESSMPAVRKRLLPYCLEYGFNYKFARFWTTEKMHEILSKYSYYIGASSPRSSRFTYKLVESVNAGTVCLLPSISLIPLGIENSFSQKLLDKYEDSIMVLNNPDKLRSIISCDTTEYLNILNIQRNFLFDYFDIDSDNINTLIKQIL